jgi:hypothetical protein
MERGAELIIYPKKKVADWILSAIPRIKNSVLAGTFGNKEISS